jgi:hypothetical protein
MTPRRTESFVPLTPAPAQDFHQEFRVRVLSDPTQVAAFQSIESRLAPRPQTREASSHNASCEPHVSVQREGDRVSSIRIQCSCGQSFDLACVYQEPARNG